jgi:hypothetical protein
VKKLIRISILIAVSFVLFTWWALESDGVAVIETAMPNGQTRSTHVWFAETNGDVWIEAGTPENTWYVDIQQESTGSLAAAERSGQYIAETIPGEAAHLRVRSLLRKKYGIRDRWIDFIFDTSKSIAVRLVPKSSRKASND